MEKEYCEITTENPFFKGHVTKEKLIELKEKEGWKYKGNKSLLGLNAFGGGFTGSKIPEPKILALLEREIK